MPGAPMDGGMGGGMAGQPSTPSDDNMPPITGVEICGNGIDDDGDGLTDGQDPITCPDEDEEICDDGIDNNNDGLTDEEDTIACPENDGAIDEEEICDDGIDNDGDELIDEEDSQDCEPEEEQNEEPDAVAVLLGNEVLNVGDSATLDGSLSSDPDGDELTYSWSQASGPTASISSPSSVSPQFTVPKVQGFTKLTFRLVVEDTFSQLNQPKLESTDAVDVFVCPSNSTPDPQTESCEYSKIDVRARPIQGIEDIPTAWHFFIIYTDEKGKDYFFSGFPRLERPDDPESNDVIGYATGEYKPGTADYPNPGKVPEAVSVTVLKGKDNTQGKKACFEKELERIYKLNKPYSIYGPNSNTVAKTLLKNCGVPDKWPTGVWDVKGWEFPIL